jgi:hypothetical protein
MAGREDGGVTPNALERFFAEWERFNQRLERIATLHVAALSRLWADPRLFVGRLKQGLCLERVCKRVAPPSRRLLSESAASVNVDQRPTAWPAGRWRYVGFQFADILLALKSL